ncbi:hypothetical protein [Desulfofundulus thermosubterraneus]|uniref:Uncharacterized protein n=1 Tax=Desulfofundulus thermosubterraneus DSM 16057 TaxID=1121432 RepID=A0A1M6MX27_9FIRM|nr:hypothetical protein [Desulfofundulus thermosubterraneus]SHJ87950.1 hypothetical protein SAMN02745219_03547 [Desulfofundulus thermosubterraneus DSM 16057]
MVLSSDISFIVKNRTITASEWFSWRERGMSNAEVATMLGVSPSMARIVARKFREAGVPDPQYRKRKPGPVKILDTTTDAGAYVLGILWGTASASGEGYWVRHRDKWYIDVVREYLGVTAEGYECYSRTGNQWRLKITRAADVAAVRGLLEHNGWTPRKAPERSYPSGNIDDRGFVRAWVELHSSADVARTGRKRMPTPRLRVYGSFPMLEEMNRVIAVGTGLLQRKLQLVTTGTGETWCLCYTGGSFRAVVEWLYAEGGLYNPTVRERFENFALSVNRLRKPT